MFTTTFKGKITNKNFMCSSVNSTYNSIVIREYCHSSYNHIYTYNTQNEQKKLYFVIFQASSKVFLDILPRLYSSHVSIKI